MNEVSARPDSTAAAAVSSRPLIGVSALAIAFAAFLLFWRLSWSGFTWDEYVDFQVARSYLDSLRNILANDMDPSQGRLNHVLAIPALKTFGVSLFSFKLTFAVVGVATGAAMYGLLRRLVSGTTAFYLTAVFVSFPYFLGSARTAATAGDSLTLLTVTLVFLTLIRWVTGEGRGSPIWCGVACGLAIGAKLTNGLLVPLALIWAADTHGWKRGIRDGAWFLVATFTFALLAHPLFLKGPAFITASIANSHGFDNAAYLRYLGTFVKKTQWYFPLALLLAKTSLPFMLLFAGSLWREGAAAWRTRKVDDWQGISLVILAFTSFFLLKHFQNAHYYLPALVPMVVLCARTVDRLIQVGGKLALAGLTGLLVVQGAVNLDLSPDFLQAGKHYGERFQGPMAGPAVNHCQAGPVAIAELNALQRTHPYPKAYILIHCGPILAEDQYVGPVRSAVPIQDYPAAPPPRPFWLLVARTFDYSYNSQAELDAAVALREQTLRGCTLESKPDGAFRIYSCK